MQYTVQAVIIEACPRPADACALRMEPSQHISGKPGRVNTLYIVGRLSLEWVFRDYLLTIFGVAAKLLCLTSCTPPTSARGGRLTQALPMGILVSVSTWDDTSS